MGKYIPQIGDVVMDNGIPVVVLTINSHENVGSCCYDREYYVCEEKYLHKLSGTMTTIDAIREHGRWICIKGANFPDIEQVTNIPPYEITPIEGFHIRQKKAKTVTVFE